VVVDVLLTVDGLSSLNVLLDTDVLLDDLGGYLGADLGVSAIWRPVHSTAVNSPRWSRAGGIL
jgi:hypothetical protein